MGRVEASQSTCVRMLSAGPALHLEKNLEKFLKSGSRRADELCNAAIPLTQIRFSARTPRLRPNPAILGTTMGDSPDFQTPDQRKQRAWVSASDWVDETEPKLTKEEQQELAHGRGRICKERGCVVCAPLRESRRLKKTQRKIAAQAELHEKGQPCNRASCSLAVCVAARDAAPASPPTAPSVEQRAVDQQTSQPTDQQANQPTDDAEQVLRREAKRHRVGLPCGSEDCPNQVCIDGFTIECTRRHRARRPCRSATCDIAICVAGRSKK